METQVLEGKWTRLRAQMKEKWSKLTDADLERIQGQREQLEGALRERYGYGKKRAQEEVDDFLQTVDSQLDDVRGQVQQQVQTAQERLQEQMAGARQAAGVRAEAYNRQVRDAAPREVERAVDEYPWLTLIGVFVAGLLLGAILGSGK